MSLLDTEVFHHSVTSGIKLFLSKTSHFGVFGFLVVSVLGLNVLSLSFFSSLPVSAESKQSSLTITTTSSSHNISIMPSPSGTFGKSNSSTIRVSTNNYSGYTLSISMPTTSGVSSGSLSDGLGHEITTLGSAVSESAFSGSSGTSYNNKWGYRPSQYVNSTSGSNTVVSNTSFLPAPSSTGTLIDVTSSANSTAKSYTLDVATRISSSLPAGSYAGRLIITAVANNIVYNLNYDKNTTSDVSNMPTPNPQVATIAGGTAASESVTTLSSTIPTRTGYNFTGWCSVATTNDTTTGSQTCPGTTYPAGGSYGIDQTSDGSNIRLYAIWASKTYTINLNGNGATTAGSSTTTATYSSPTLSTITNPSRVYNIGGYTLPSGNKADGATVTYPSSGNCTSSSNCKSTYTFNGWYKESGATNKIASNATTPVLQASTSYTDANGKWTYTTTSPAVTLYAGWISQAVTLPTITKTGHTCGWTATSTGATSITYASGGSLTPTGNVTLYGVCTTNSYTITLDRNGGSTGSTSTTVAYGATTLSAITVPTRANTTGTRTVSGLTADGTNASGATVTFSTSGTCASTTNCKSTNTTTYTFNGWYKESGATNKIASNAATPVLQANTSYTNASGAWTSTSAQTLYAGWTSSAGAYSSLTLPTITKTGYTCGWDTNASATNPTYASGASLTPTGNLTLHGICKANTYTITLNGNGATTPGSGTATATYDSTTLSTITNPSRSYTISGFDTSYNNASGATVSSSSTLTSTYTFNGWYKESSATNKIASNATTPVLQASTTYTDANGKWTSTSAQTLYAGWTAQAKTLPTITKTGHTCGWTTSTSTSTITYASGGSITPSANTVLHGVCTTNSYTITLNANGGSGGSSSTTVSYGATTLGTITNPSRASTTGTRTISGFTMTTSGTNASVTYPSSGCTSATNCKSTNTTTYTFNGWYKETGATNKIASNATTPVLQASTSYTDANGKWTSTSGQTLYAGWTSSAGAYSSVTLPTITRTGSTCGWSTSSTATTWDYNSGASVTPTGNMTLYGVCTINKYTLTINFAGTGVSSVQVRTASGTGGTLMGTVSTSGGTVSNLTYNTNYYLYPSFTTAHEFVSWAKTSGAGTLSSTSTSNPYYTIGAGNATVTITGKDECAGYICYNANGSNVVGTMGKQSVSDGSSVDLLASNFSRAGYGFAGWSDKADPTTSGAKLYGPQEKITVPTGTSENGLRLYAIWIQSAGSLQTDAGAVCKNLTPAPTDGTANLSSVSALTDQRDNNTYAIAKLADGNCWMIENLRLDSTASHNSDGSLAQGYGTSATYGNFGGLANAESANFENVTTANSLYYSGTQSGTANINIGTSNYPGYRMPRYNNLNTSTRASSPTNNSGNMYSYGNYYTWHAAIADLTYNGADNQSATGTSLCPAGWHLPKGGNKSNEANNELWSLVVDGINGGTKPANYDSSTYPYYTGTPEGSDASNKLRAYPNNFLYSGLFDTSSALDRGSSGNYWSSTAYGNVSSYYLYLRSSRVRPGTLSDNKYYGYSIRCLLSTITSATYLQDVTKEMVDNTPEGTTATLKDKRDEQSYTVAKLADGNVWLLDNLALDLTNSTVLNGMNESNTNASNTTLNYLKGTTTRDPSTDPDGQYATAGVSNWTPSHSYSAPLVNLTDKDVVPTDATSTSGQYKVGGYYNYCAASAGSYCYGNGTSYGTSSGNATEDICPKGWRMPTGNTSGEYSALANAIYGSTGSTSDSTAYANYRSALRLPLSGYFLNGSANYQGSRGSWWSSTYLSNDTMYSLFADTSAIRPANYGSRVYGFSVRCLFDSRTISDVSYLQDVTPAIASNTAEGTTATLKDKRDEQSYTVAKLKDGKLWMTENLNLAGGTALSADDTDVTSDYISSFSTSNNLTKSGNTIVLPASSTSGFDTDNYSYVYNSGNKENCGASGQNTPCYSYYSWDAATLGSGRTIATDNTNAEQSICPKGWKLPSTYNGSGTAAEATDFRKLMIGYGGSNSIRVYNSSTTPTGATMYGNIGPGTTPNFLLAGYFNSGSFRDGGGYGRYWSSTSSSNTSVARYLYFSSSNVNSANSFNRRYGFSVRCLFSPSTQPSNSPQSVSPNQSSTSSQPTASNSVSPDSTSVQPTRSAPLAMSAPTQNATPSTNQDALQDNSSTDSTDSTDSTNSTDSTTTTDPSSTTTSPHGVTTELSDDNEKQASAVRTSLAIAAGTTATAGTILFLLAKRKKDEDEDEESENSQP